jgi:hypothetical protein
MPISCRYHGFALIELLLVLGVGVLIISLVWSTYASRNEDVKVVRTLDGLNRLVDIADSSYSTTAGYSRVVGATTQYATVADLHASAKELPDSILDLGAGAYSNLWGGTWTASVENSTGTAADLLALTVTQLPSYACLQLVGFASPKMYDTTINGTLVGLSPARTTAVLGRSEIRVPTTVSLCAAATNTIKFRHFKPVDYTMLRNHPFGQTLDPNPASVENTVYVPTYNRVEAAITAREAAQVALP